MSKRVYPRKVWVLTPTFNVKEVEVVKAYGSISYDYGDITSAGKLYARTEMYDNKKDAISAGRRSIGAQEVKIAIMSNNVNKKRTNLDKCEAAE